MRAMRRHRTSKPRPAEVVPSTNLSADTAPAWDGWAALLALVSMILFLSSFPNFKNWLPFIPSWMTSPWWILPAAFGVFRTSRRESRVEGGWEVKPLFWIILGAGMWLRLRNFGDPVPTFWDDHSLVWSDIRNVLDLGDRPILFSYGWREPFHVYGSAFLMVLFPFLDIHRAVQALSTLSDAALMVVMYLWGREMGGRWTGLAALAFVALSRPVIVMTLYGFGNTQATLAAALVGWTFSRVLQRPDFHRFVVFGLTLGFGAYTYAAFRPVAPAAVILSGMALLRDRGERKRAFTLPGATVLGVGFLWVFIFLWKQRVLPGPLDAAARLFQPFWMKAALIWALCAGWMRMMALSERDGGGRGLAAWATGSILGLVMTWPVMSHPMYGGRMGQLFAAKANGPGLISSLGNGARTLLDWTLFSISNAFGSSPILSRGLYDAPTIVFSFIGILVLLLKPSFERIGLLFLLVAGISPFIMSHPCSPVRIASATGLLFGVAAWGAWILASGVSRSRPARATLVAVFLLIVYGQYREMDRIIVQWHSRPNLDVLLSNNVRADYVNSRVYLVSMHPGFFTSSQVPLNEGRDVNIVEDPRGQYPINLRPGEPVPKVVIYHSIRDTTTASRLASAYPQSVASPVPGLEKAAVRVELFPSEHGSARTEMFPVVRREGVSWRRKFYSGRYGLARGIVAADDLAASLSDPFPPGNWNNATAKASAFMEADRETELSLTAEGAGPFVILLDGKRVLRNDGETGPAKKERRIRIGTGVHHLQVRSHFGRTASFPRIEGLPTLSPAPSVGPEGIR